MKIETLTWVTVTFLSLLHSRIIGAQESTEMLEQESRVHSNLLLKDILKVIGVTLRQQNAVVQIYGLFSKFARQIQWQFHAPQLNFFTIPCGINFCGSHTTCAINPFIPFFAECNCLSGYVSHPTIKDTCIRPCLASPCGTNTFCIDISDGSRICICLPDYSTSSSDNEAIEGCTIRSCMSSSLCGVNTYCTADTNGDDACFCLMNYYPANTGDEYTVGCVQRPCMVEDACGPNAFCTEDFEFTKTCCCKTDYYEATAGDAATTTGCAEPCTGKCTGAFSVCHALSATTYECACISGYSPISNNAETNGCHKTCPYVLATYIVEEEYCLSFNDYGSLYATWDDADTACQNEGGTLAVLDLADANLGDTLLSYFPVLANPPDPVTNDIFLGGIAAATTYEWIDNVVIPNNSPNWLNGPVTVNAANIVGLAVPVLSGSAIINEFAAAGPPRSYLCQFLLT